jgi:hypothetical protein
VSERVTLSALACSSIHPMRYLIEVDGASFPFEQADSLERGDNFTHEGKTYIASFIEPGNDDFDGVVKATFAGEIGPGQAG